MRLFNKRSAWDKIKATLSAAAERTADTAGQWERAAVDAAGSGWGAATSAGHAVGDRVRSGATAGAGAVRSGVAAVGRGVEAVEDKVDSVANGVVAGAIAGALAAWAMNQFQTVSAKPVAARRREAAELGSVGGGEPALRSAQSDGSGENATVQVAEKVSREALGHELTGAEKPVAGAAVHYGYGAAMGALYGGLSELVPVVGTGLGIPYATALWLFGDEIAVSKLGLGKPIEATTPAEHAASFSAHLVYGVTLDVARRVLRHIV
jgi:putative membrane protein